jgi:CheY-like chemotaxis protein
MNDQLKNIPPHFQGRHIMSEKILLVDDEKEFLDVMSERIEARGMDVTTAESAEKALKDVESGGFWKP